MAIGSAITFLFFLPAANLIVHIGTIMGERLFYLPLAGLCLVLGTGWDWIARWLARSGRRSVRSFYRYWGGSPIAGSTHGTNHHPEQRLENNATLFASTVRSQPGSAKAHAMMASLHLQRGELNKALEEFEAALTILPRYVEFPRFAQRYGSVLTKLGRTKEAIAVMEAATRTNPERARDPFIQRELAIAHERNNDLAMASAARKRAITISQAIPRTSAKLLVMDYGELARVYTLQGRTAEARRALEVSLKLADKDQHLSQLIRTRSVAQILGNLALIDTLEGDYTRAEKRYLQAFELLRLPLLADQKHVRIARLRDYASLLRKMGRTTDADKIDEKAASLGSP